MSNIKSADPLTVQTWITGMEAILIDVREPIEFQAGHIAHSINIPLSRFEADIKTTDIVSGKKIIMVCQAGIRSMTACRKLSLLIEALDSWNLEGGINKWHSLGLPLVKI